VRLKQALQFAADAGHGRDARLGLGGRHRLRKGRRRQQRKD
jgi:hypothetical protein